MVNVIVFGPLLIRGACQRGRHDSRRSSWH